MARKILFFRPILSLALAFSGHLYGQGVASRGIQPLLRSEPSGLPFHARFTDVAHQAGLRSPVVYGDVDSKEFILETIGPGAAFFDYDKDGWLDIFLLSGARRDSVPEDATNRLYRNRRDGTFEDVTTDAGLTRTGWASGVTVGDFDNDGNEDLFVTYWAKTSSIATTETAGLASRQAPLACFTKALAGVRFHVPRLRPRRFPGSVRGELLEV